MIPQGLKSPYDRTGLSHKWRDVFEHARNDPQGEPEFTSRRVLVNAFFTYCNPYSFIIHKPSFQVSVSQKTAPSYLVCAVCAVAALFGGQDPRVSRYPFKSFVEQTTSLLFDIHGRLVCVPALAVAQALCLLHICAKKTDSSYKSQYRDLAMQTIRSLFGTLDADTSPSPLLPPLDDSIPWVELECARRIFWLLWLVDAVLALNSKHSVSLTIGDLLVPLPIDELHFEQAKCRQKPEYAHVPLPSYSEFGHVLRILMIFVMLRLKVGGLEGFGLLMYLNDYSQAINSWESSLPDHLLFSESQLRKQLMRIDTSSSSCAWSFCCMHLIRVSSILAISVLQGKRTAVDHAMVQAELVVRYLGCQTKTDILLESILLCIDHYLEEADVPDNTRDMDYASILRHAWQSIAVQLGHPKAGSGPEYSHSVNSSFSQDFRASSRNQLTLPPLKSTGLLD